MDQLDRARETSLSRILDVLEAAIVAASHATWGERPVLVVTLKGGKALDKAGILALYEDRVPKWWVPDDVVALEMRYTHTATGKLNKLSRFAIAFAGASHRCRFMWGKRLSGLAPVPLRIRLGPKCEEWNPSHHVRLGTDLRKREWSFPRCMSPSLPHAEIRLPASTQHFASVIRKIRRRR